VDRQGRARPHRLLEGAQRARLPGRAAAAGVPRARRERDQRSRLPALAAAAPAWRQRGWTRIADELRAAIPHHLVDERGRWLHGRFAGGNEPAGIADWTEWGLFLLDRGDPTDAEDISLAARNVQELLENTPGLGDDGARPLWFLARVARARQNGEAIFAALGLLETLAASDPAPSPAALGLAGWELDRE